MSAHTKHQHCAHAHLAFCTTCQVVYCHDCAKEWTERSTWIYPNTFGGTLTYGMGQGTNQVYPPGTVLTRTHTHGG